MGTGGRRDTAGVMRRPLPIARTHTSSASFSISTIFRQDPRYYRLGQGGGGERLGHAVAHTFVSRGNSGGKELNFSLWGRDRQHRCRRKPLSSRTGPGIRAGGEAIGHQLRRMPWGSMCSRNSGRRSCATEPAFPRAGGGSGRGRARSAELKRAGPVRGPVTVHTS